MATTMVVASSLADGPPARNKASLAATMASVQAWSAHFCKPELPCGSTSRAIEGPADCKMEETGAGVLEAEGPGVAGVGEADEAGGAGVREPWQASICEPVAAERSEKRKLHAAPAAIPAPSPPLPAEPTPSATTIASVPGAGRAQPYTSSHTRPARRWDTPAKEAPSTKNSSERPPSAR